MAPSVVCINTQTPLVQFLDTPGASRGLGGGRREVDLSALREGVDYRLSPGGVTRMVYPLLRRLLETNVLQEAHWVALNPRAPPRARVGRITLHNIPLEPTRMAGYGATKEAIWGRLHETDGSGGNGELFWTEAFAEYAYYNRRTAERIRELDEVHDFDAFYVHDFQQLPVGQMLGTLKPKIFRWHIPFDAKEIPETWRATLRGYLESYDEIVVSATRYARSLATLAPSARIRTQYPYVDPADYSRPPSREVAQTATRFGIRSTDDVALLVGRMDPVKGQNVAVEALALLAERYPRLRLVLVGNGSFSGSKSGLALSKSSTWRAQLESKVQGAGLNDRVVFTGHVGQRELDALYERCRFTLMPSLREGFGLVAVESWLHGKPAIVSKRAGIADLIQDGTNGLLVDPRRPAALARAMRRLLDDATGALTARLARLGRATARRCSLRAAERAERTLLARFTQV